jgi:hypothetical protein
MIDAVDFGGNHSVFADRHSVGGGDFTFERPSISAGPWKLTLPLTLEPSPK